ncbi:MAG: RodZ domain-containing protein [Brevinema sp.]
MINQNKLSLGNYLRQQREAKGLSIDEAAIETNIARKYIEALENDEYGFFPAEMYVVGFLTAYVEVLEMDKELVLSMYQRSLAKEQEAPLEEVFSLYNNDVKVKRQTIILMITLPIIIILALFSMFLSSGNSSSDQSITINSSENISTIVEGPEELSIDLNSLSQNNEFTVKVNDIIALTKDNTLQNSIKFLGTTSMSKQIKFQLGQNTYTQKRGDILNADLYGDGNNNLTLEIIDISHEQVRFVLSIKETVLQKNTAGEFNIGSYAKSIRTETALGAVDVFPTITMKLTSTGNLWVEYQIDNQKSVSQLVKTGQNLSIKFKDSLRLLLGNSGTANISFQELPTATIRGGTAGESSYSIFYRKKTQTGIQLYRALLK